MTLRLASLMGIVLSIIGSGQAYADGAPASNLRGDKALRCSAVFLVLTTSPSASEDMTGRGMLLGQIAGAYLGPVTNGRLMEARDAYAVAVILPESRGLHK